MKKIRLHISKIKKHFYAKIPDAIADSINLSNGENIEVTIHQTNKSHQVEMWKKHPEDIDEISFYINNDVHTINMYNRIYIPEKFRFFFPMQHQDILLITNAGNIKTFTSTRLILYLHFLSSPIDIHFILQFI